MILESWRLDHLKMFKSSSTRPTNLHFIRNSITGCFPPNQKGKARLFSQETAVSEDDYYSRLSDAHAKGLNLKKVCPISQNDYKQPMKIPVKIVSENDKSENEYLARMARKHMMNDPTGEFG